MTQCPKCSSRSIHGPIYRQDTFGEHLEYRCNQCHYKDTRPTHDAIGGSVHTVDSLGGLDRAMAEIEKKFVGPRCHFTPMSLEASDYEQWWECRHCGHTKEAGFLSIPH